jgi:hypothetical protein
MNRYKQAADHNGEQWLEVRFLTATQRGCVPVRQAGWYVVRTCPCHSGQPVTLPFDNPERAERARLAMLAVSAGQKQGK